MLSFKLLNIIGILILGSSFMSCSKKTVDGSRGEQQMPAKTIEEVLKEHTDEWLAIPGVVGTAIGESNGKPCIKVFVVEETEELNKKIPSQAEGFPVVIQASGEIRALESDD